MDRPIFLISNYSRKPEFQTQTRALKEKSGAIVFQKVALNDSALPHLSNIKKTSDTLINNGLGSLFCKASSKDDSIIFERIKGENFENLLLEAVLRNDNKKLHGLLEEYEIFLKKVVADSNNEHEHSYDKKIFGSGFFDKFSGSGCIRPGILDLNFDNMIETKNGLKAIDYEWVFAHCLPYDYILTRTIMWFGLRYSDILKMHSERIDLMALSDEIMLPAGLLDKYPGLPPKIKKVYSIEWKYLQHWVTSHFEKQLFDFYEKPIKYSEKTRFAIDHLEANTAIIERLNGEVLRLNNEVGARDSEIERLNSILRQKPHRAISKAYKANVKIRRAVRPSSKKQ